MLGKTPLPPSALHNLFTAPKNKQNFIFTENLSIDYHITTKTQTESKGEAGKDLDGAHPLFLDNGAPISWASFIMNVYGDI